MYSILEHKVPNLLSYKKINRDKALSYIKESKLLGRGGAAFLVYKKWENFISAQSEKKYVLVNAHEGELNCAKDAYLITHNANAILDGALITRYLTNANNLIICLKRSDKNLVDIINSAKIPEIEIHVSCDDYIAGEETALIEEVEHGFAYPRTKPPFPAVSGLGGHPTLVHNAETMAHISYIARNGIDDFINTGTEYSRGTKLFSITGAVNSPGVYEAEFGISLRKFIDEYAGGLSENLYAIMPGFSKIIKACNSISLDYESFFAVGSHLGTGNIRVFSSPDTLKLCIEEAIRFIAKASCGQCSTCRTICKIAQGVIAKIDDISELTYYINNVHGLSRCALMSSMLDMLQNYLEGTR